MRYTLSACLFFACFTALAATYGKPVTSLLVTLLDQNAPAHERRIAMRTLNIKKKVPDFVPEFIEALHHKNPRIRAFSARNLAHMRINAKKAVPDLIKAQLELNQWVNGSASIALRAIVPSGLSGIQASLNALEKPQKESDYLYAVWHLSHLKHLDAPQQRNKTLLILKKHTNPWVKASIIWGLSDSADKNILPYMYKTLKTSTDPIQKAACIDGLKYFSSTKTVKVLASHLQTDPDSRVRQGAVESLVFIFDTEFEIQKTKADNALFLKLLETEKEPWVRTEIVNALSIKPALEVRKVLPALIARYGTDTSEEVKLQIIKTIPKFGLYEESIKILEQASQETSHMIKGAALEGLKVLQRKLPKS